MAGYFSCLATKKNTLLFCELDTHQEIKNRAALRGSADYVKIEVLGGDIAKFRVAEDRTLPAWYIASEELIRKQVHEILQEIAGARKAYFETTEPDRDMYKQATQPARQVFEQTKAAAQHSYETSMAESMRAFDEAIAVAGYAYETATAGTRRAYQLALSALMNTRRAARQQSPAARPAPPKGPQTNTQEAMLDAEAWKNYELDTTSAKLDYEAILIPARKVYARSRAEARGLYRKALQDAANIYATATAPAKEHFDEATRLATEAYLRGLAGIGGYVPKAPQ